MNDASSQTVDLSACTGVETVVSVDGGSYPRACPGQPEPPGFSRVHPGPVLATRLQHPSHDACGADYANGHILVWPLAPMATIIGGGRHLAWLAAARGAVTIQ